MNPKVLALIRRINELYPPQPWPDEHTRRLVKLWGPMNIKRQKDDPGGPSADDSDSG